ncbi:MarR family winged helix-turn-helix transcriptional regulator [Bittarella massiliensis (ex Durand et al. 2017)]|uniref:MarR family winged helix-turn-helix transcriptional regulator n=1 Tax=Bittarella massiliensis (ex Durand et al. 2017) TaxID=1720313 RepID=UPI001AA0B457|nr:MarR family transcriptional regulator [Bittarella massiliensis (ex Durand et al. 2017)]MBO1679478.1 MarR family transcriptional regulator [Bittarella massiliensis (ex Durand et al. 2017)]
MRPFVGRGEETMTEQERIREHVRAYYEHWYQMDSLYSAWCQRHGLQFNTVVALYVIRDNPAGCTQKHICEKTALPKQTVSFILSGLERQGYIRRHQNERDHRNKSVQITPAGEAALYPVLDALSAAEEQAYCLLSEEQRQAITGGHQLLLRAMRQAMAGEAPAESR